jgi:hypothetical protein
VYSYKKHEELRKNRNGNFKKSSFLTAFGFEWGLRLSNLEELELTLIHKS